MIIKIKVKANAGKQEVIKVDNRKYEVSLRSKAENNKANLELLKLLRRYFKKDIRIIAGVRSKNKILEVKKIDEKW